jgi:hypothetical protein
MLLNIIKCLQILYNFQLGIKHNLYIQIFINIQNNNVKNNYQWAFHFKYFFH